MTVEADLKTLLTLDCARVFPDFAPVGTVRPYVTYQQVGGEAINFVDNATPDLKHGEFQINVWADSRPTAAALMLAIEARMRGATAFTARPIGAPISDYDADVPVYGARQDFSVHSTR